MSKIKFGDIYSTIMEAKIDKKDITNRLSKWLRSNSSSIKDKNKVKQAIKNIGDYDEADEDNVIVMDEITEMFMIISKQINDDVKASDELADILQKL